MTSNTLSTSDIGALDIFSTLSEQERSYIKALIQENIQKNDLKNSMSVGLFFSSIQILKLPHLCYTEDTIREWNKWIEWERAACICRSKANSIKMPAVRFDRLRTFFDALISQDLISGVNPITEAMHINTDKKVADLL